VLNATGGGPSTLACGPDADIVEGPAVEHLLNADCESARDTGPFTTVGVQPRTLTADGRATFDVSCARTVGGSCDGTLHVGGASAPYSVGSGTAGSVLVQLGPAEAAAAAAAGGLVTAIRVEAVRINSFAWTTTLHAA
jgi:hypothetical protein